MNSHANAIVLAQGSTPSRTRLYQMGITSFLNEIEKNFFIDGYVESNWESFVKQRNYEAFLFKRK